MSAAQGRTAARPLARQRPRAVESAPEREAERGPRFCALRGATTVAADEPALIAAAVRELLGALMDANALAPADVVSAIFSATPDLHTLYPAAAARELGWTDVPMLCVAEMDVPGRTPPRCVRVLLHVSVDATCPRRAVYLHDARWLRPDLVDRG